MVKKSQLVPLYYFYICVRDGNQGTPDMIKAPKGVKKVEINSYCNVCRDGRTVVEVCLDDSLKPFAPVEILDRIQRWAKREFPEYEIRIV